MSHGHMSPNPYMGSPPPTRFYLVGQLTTPHIAALIHLSERRCQLWRALPVTMTWMLTVQVYSEHASHGWRWCASKYNVQSLSAKSSPICDASSCEICGGIYGYTLWLLASQRLWSTFTFNSTTSSQPTSGNIIQMPFSTIARLVILWKPSRRFCLFFWGIRSGW